MILDQKQLLERIEAFLILEHYDSLKRVLRDQRTSDTAEVVETLDEDERRKIFDLLDTEAAAEVLERVDEATRENLFEILGEDELGEIVRELDADDAADILSELSEEEAGRVLGHLDRIEALKIRKLMLYSEDSAGGIMDPVVISVHEDASVHEAIRKIRESEVDEDFYSIFVVNSQEQFLGEVRIRQLITCHEETQLNQLVDTDALYVYTDADQEEVRNLFNKNELIVIPVLDAQQRLVGRITADRVIEVAQDEADEDRYVMAGTNPAELERESIFNAARIRMTWLLPCLIGTGITAVIMIFFEKGFQVVNMAGIYSAVVASFVPMIAAISGNAGLQTSAIVVSGLARGDLAAIQLRQVFAREVRIAVLVALACGIIGGLICGGLIVTDVMESGPEGAAVQTLRIVTGFVLAMFTSVMVATTLGLFLPFLFRKVGIDPAIASGPLVTTANDSISVAIYLTLTLVLIS